MYKDFSRNNQELEATNKTIKVVCNDEKLQEFIETWTHDIGWDSETFVNIVEQTGIKLPITLSDFKEERNSFKCTSIDGTVVVISIYLADDWGHQSKIWITEGNEIRKYQPSHRNENGNKPLTVTLVEKIIKGKRNLTSLYKEDSYEVKVNFEDSHVLEVKIRKIGNDDRIFNTILEKHEKLEEYLLGFDEQLVKFSKVYCSIKKFIVKMLKPLEQLEQLEQKLLKDKRLVVIFHKSK